MNRGSDERGKELGGKGEKKGERKGERKGVREKRGRATGSRPRNLIMECRKLFQFFRLPVE